MASKLLRYKYVLIIATVVAVLCYLNYTPGTWLTGWDDSHPEFNFPLNISRAVNDMWREHRGLGLVSGLAHSATIFRYLFLWIASVVVPVSFLRYLWQFVMLLIGPIGVFYLARHLFYRTASSSRGEMYSFVSAVFYLFNLTTLQTFYVPLETFTTQYGFLPWLFLVIFRILENPNKKNVLVFIFLNIFSASQAFTPTLFIAYISFVLVIILVNIFSIRTKTSVKSALLILLVLLFSNLYWILPFGYFLSSGRALGISQATINVLSSEETFLMNNQHGSILDVASLKGFLFSTTDYNNQSNSYEWLLDKWVIYQSQIGIKYLGVLAFVVVILGLSKLLLSRKDITVTVRIGLSTLFFLSLFFLMANNPPFGLLFQFLQNNIPYFQEALRYPFTKYSILAALVYACLFGLGIFVMSEAVTRISSRFAKLTVWIHTCPVILSIIVLFVWVFPMFQGEMIYKRLRVQIPEDYFSMFNYINNDDSTSGKILKLPIQTYWSWGFNDWGYRGSGFTWYGTSLPTIDRAFDVWSPDNESVYREVSYAVYSNNPNHFKKVLDKYDISYVFVDRSVIEPLVSNDRFIGLENIDKLLTDDGSFILEKKYGQLSLYRYKHYFANDVKVVEKPVSIEAEATWLTYDPVFTSAGHYVQLDSTSDNYYPFFSLGNYLSMATKYRVDSNKDSLILNTSSNYGGLLYIPKYFDEETSLLVSVSVESGNVVLKSKLPRIITKGVEIPPMDTLTYSINLPSTDGSYLLTIDNSTFGPLSKTSSGEVGSVFLNVRKAHKITFWDYENPYKDDLMKSFLMSEVDSCINRDYGSYELRFEGNSFTLASENNVACIAATKGSLDSLDLFRIEYTGDFVNSSINYCIYGSTDCINDYRYPSDYHISPKDHLPFTLQFYSEPIDNSLPAESTFSSITLLSYRKVFEIEPVLIDYVSSSSNRLANVEAGNLQIDVPKPINDGRSYIYETFDGKNDSYLTHECNFSSGVSVDSDFSTTVSTSGNELVATTQKKSSCFTLSNKYLAHDIGYYIDIPYRHISGKSQKICLQNDLSGRCDLIYKLPSAISSFYNKAGFFIPEYSDGGLGYKLTIENTSIGDDVVKNAYDNLGVYPFPYKYVSKLVINKTDAVDIPARTVDYKKLSSALYTVDIKGLATSGTTVLLNQGFDSGWLMLCGTKLCNAKHVQVDNWANGWVFDSNPNASNIVIVFWPQVMQYLGFSALFGLIILIGLRKFS